VTLDAGGGTDRGGGGGQNTESAVSFSLTILAAPAPSPTPGGCALAGIVYDGDITSDFHNNPMPHIPVQLFRDGAAVDEPVTTDAVGHYCIPEGIAEPGDYRLRATLADVPLLETRHTSDVGATWTDVPIVATDFGRQNADISFTHSDTRPWLSDVANIHWQATRYVEWLTDTLELAPGLMGPATIIAFDPTRTAFDARNHRITISVSDSVFNSRSDSSSIGPAGIEWHELTHHLLEAIGAGAADNCPLQDPDGSWDNASTCASLDEGIALFLPALAAADLNPTAAESVSFGIHANLEDNDYYPWSFVSLGNVTAQRESFAVAQLLWDLTDDTPLERAPIAFTATPVATFTGSDTIAYGIDQLFHVIAAEPHPTTVDDLFKFIAVDLPPGTLANGIDIDSSGSTDADPLQELLLIHGFHPVHDPMFPSYFIGTTVGRTDHVPVPSSAPDLFVRNRPVALPGESIRFTNPGSTAVTYSIDITYPGATSHFDVPVPAGGERVFEFEPPPYWRGALAAGAALPACGADQVKVSVALSGGGETPRTVDGCEYLHLAAAAGSGSALSFGRAATALAVPALGPIVALLAAGVIVALIGGVILLRRRRPAAG
jgi:hypothetical protein